MDADVGTLREGVILYGRVQAMRQVGGITCDGQKDEESITHLPYLFLTYLRRLWLERSIELPARSATITPKPQWNRRGSDPLQRAHPIPMRRSPEYTARASH